MIQSLKAKLLKYKIYKNTKLVAGQLNKDVYRIADIDHNNGSILVDLGNNLDVLISIDRITASQVRLETSMVFSGDTLNLKTYSELANICYAEDVPLTGVYAKGDGKVKIYISKTVQMSAVHILSKALLEIINAITLCQQYLQLRSNCAKYPMLDLSMFSDLEIDNFFPKDLGEKKDFIHGSWQSFIDAILRDYDSGTISPEDASITIKELEACRLFEEANDLLLSEVGDTVYQEIVWNRDLLARIPDDDDTYIN